MNSETTNTLTALTTISKKDPGDTLAPEEIETWRRTQMVVEAHHHGINLKLGNLATLMGDRQASRYTRAKETFKRNTPEFLKGEDRLRTSTERFTHLKDLLHDQAFAEDAARTEAMQLQAWHSRLSDGAQKAAQYHTHNRHGDLLVVPTALSVGERRWYIGNHSPASFGLDTHVLPTEVQHELGARHFFRSAMEVETAKQFSRFKEDHFTLERADVSNPNHRSPELAWLAAKDPEIFAQLQDMQTAGHKIDFRKISRMPHGVLNAVDAVSDDVYNTYMHTWLPRVVTAGEKPLMSDEEWNDNKKHIAVIEQFRRLTLGIEIEGDLNNEELKALEQANELLADGLGREYTLRYLLHDCNARKSESIIETLKKIPALVLGAYVVQKFAPMAAIQDAAEVFGSADDIVAETAGIPRLGLNAKERKKRYSVFVPASAITMLADYEVNNIERYFDGRAAAAIYGATVVALSGVSTAMSMVTNEGRYRTLAEAGKLGDGTAYTPAKTEQLKEAWRHYVSLDPVRKWMVGGIAAGPLLGGAIGPWMLDKPYVFVPLGTIEPLMGLAGATIEKHRLPRGLAAYTKQETRKLATA
jgi:hypothetical protein